MNIAETIKTRCSELLSVTTQIDELLGTEEHPREETLSDDERTKLDTLESQAEAFEAEIEKLKGDQERQLRQAARKRDLGTKSRGLPFLPAEPGRAATDASPVIRPKHWFRLRAFSGERAEEDAYESGMFFLAAFGSGEPQQRALAFCREHNVANLAHAGNIDIKGGALVPEQFERTVIALMEKYGVFRANANNVPMESDTLVIPRRTGGLTAYFVGDNAEVTASDTAWDQVRLTARKLACLSKWSSELNEDAILSLADRLAAEAALAFALKEDQCGFLGTGASTYSGISGLITECATATATVVTAITGNTAFSTLDLADFESMVGVLPQYAEPRAKWYISKAGWGASMLRLLDAAGGNTRDQLEGKAQLAFLGYPVVITQVMNSNLGAQTSTNGICYFGDLALAASFGVRRGMNVKISSDRYLEYDQLGILATERFDINVHDVGDTSVAGAMVMLATPGS